MSIYWSLVPSPFHYLRSTVEQCPEINGCMILPFDPVLKRHVFFEERATPEQLASLVAAHTEIVRNDDVPKIQAWCRDAQQGSEAEKEASSRILALLSFLGGLADREVSPFCDAPILLEDDSPPEDLDTLPDSLRYLIGPALFFGERFQSEFQMVKFFEEASPQECEQLATLAERVRVANDWPKVFEWWREADKMRTRYATEIDRLFNLMDLCDLSFEGD